MSDVPDMPDVSDVPVQENKPANSNTSSEAPDVLFGNVYNPSVVEKEDSFKVTSLLFPILVISGLAAYSFWDEIQALIDPAPVVADVEPADLDVSDSKPAPNTGIADFDSLEALADADGKRSPLDNETALVDIEDPNQRIEDQLQVLTESGLSNSVITAPEVIDEIRRSTNYEVGTKTAELWQDEDLQETLDKVTKDLVKDRERAKPVKVETLIPTASTQWIIASKDDRAALYQLSKTGDPSAANALGKHMLYAEANPKAYSFFDRAAHKGHPESMLLLGYLHKEGIFITPNLEMAYAWYTLAAAFGINTESQRLELTEGLDDEMAQSYQKKAEWLLSRLHTNAVEFASRWKQTRSEAYNEENRLNESVVIR